MWKLEVVWWVKGHITIRKSAYDFLFDCDRKYASILYRFRVIASYLLNVAHFNLPHLHLSLTFRIVSSEFHWDLWHQKARVPGQSWGVVCVILRLAILIQYWRVTDTQTDMQTDRSNRHMTTAYTYRASIASRVKNTMQLRSDTWVLHFARYSGDIFGCGGQVYNVKCLKNTKNYSNRLILD